MFFKSLFVLSAAALVSVSALAVPRSGSSSPPSSWSDGLEPYSAYHTRYLALSCFSHHGTSFFEACCHPLLRGEALSSRPDKCDPANLLECDDDDDDDGDDDECDSDDISPTPHKSHPNGSAAPENVAPKPNPPKHSAPQQNRPPAPPKQDEDDSDAPTRSSGILATGSGGIATYFYQNGVAGSCGIVHNDTSKVVALDYRTYNSDGSCAKSPYCGKTIHITNKKSGKSVDAIVADCCPTCNNKNSIDLSLGAFQALASLNDGIFDVDWKIVN